MTRCYSARDSLCRVTSTSEKNQSIFVKDRNRFSNQIFSVAETRADLRVAGTRKPAAPVISPHQPSINSPPVLSSRRANRVQLTSDSYYDAHLPSIRDSNGFSDRDHQSQDELRFHSRSKAHLADASPRNTVRPPTASFSSIFNTLSRRSTENVNNPGLNIEETVIPSQVPPSRRSHRVNRPTNLSRHFSNNPVVSYKPSFDAGIDIRLSASSGDTNHQGQQQRVIGLSARMKSGTPQGKREQNIQQDSPSNKERIPHGSLYQRRSNQTTKPVVKQKVNKYRRRSEEVTQALNGGVLIDSTNNGFSATTSNLFPSASIQSRAMPLSSAAVRRVSSDAEIQARLQSLRLSMDSHLANNIHHPTPATSRRRAKSPYAHPTQQIQSTTNTPTPQTSPTNLRRNHRSNPTISSNSSQHTGSRRLQPKPRQHQQQKGKETKELNQDSPGNLYLAFIASRHLSAYDDQVFECDIDHQKLIRIFTWIKNVEDHRYEQQNHDLLLIEQEKRRLEEEDNFSLYSELQYAVDDIPANNLGKPAERITAMEFDN